MGCLSIFYYLILVFYSRRLRSTFAAFWLLSGGVHLLFGCAPFPVYVYKVLGWICLVAGALDRVEAKTCGYGLEDVFEADRTARAAVHEMMR